MNMERISEESMERRYEVARLCIIELMKKGYNFTDFVKPYKMSIDKYHVNCKVQRLKPEYQAIEDEADWTF